MIGALRPILCVFVSAALIVGAGGAIQSADPLSDIRAEAARRSRAMEWARGLTSAARLTGSHGLDAAGDWVVAQLNQLNLANVHLERWPFERRWSVTAAVFELMTPVTQSLAVVAHTWSPGTNGSQTGPLRMIRPSGKGRFETRGQSVKDAFALLLGSNPLSPEEQSRLQEFLQREGAVGLLTRSTGFDAKVVYATTGHTPEQDHRRLLVPSVAVRPDHFRQLEQAARRGDATARGNLTVAASPGGDDTGFNVIAELVGSAPAEAPVVIGAHLDSMHPATGATDNAFGCAAMIEAVRVIAATGHQPRRTIRLGLWGGEEENRRGSKAYVGAHSRDRGAVYFNLDRGAGPIVGLIAEGDHQLVAPTRNWLARVQSYGVRSFDVMATAGSDHISFRDAGVPTFSFVQDEMRAYQTTHHSSADTIDAVREGNLRQASLVVATLIWLAAQ